MGNRRQILRNFSLLFLAWTAFGIFFALQGYASAKFLGQRTSLAVLLVAWLLCGYAWLLLTPLVVYLAGRFPLQRGRVKSCLPVHLLISAIIPFIHIAIFVLIRQTVADQLGNWTAWRHEYVGLLYIDFHIDLLVYWAIVGLVHLREINRRYLERQRESMRLAIEAAELQTSLAEVRLDALKMQIHPHFLFNTLNSISVLTRDDPEAANRMLLRLSELLRVMLNSESTQEVELSQEIEFLRGYLEIEQIRFQDRLTVDFAVDQEALPARIPNLLLQPLVENAVRHGIAPRAESGTILIQARRSNGYVELSVKDNGAGARDLAAVGTGIGLANTRERLERLYGQTQQFETSSPAEGGFEVKISIPFHTDNGASQDQGTDRR